jgi:WD40 repeat protein
MSALHIRNITVNEVKHGAGGVNVLSVSSGNQLLVGQPGDSQLHVYSAEGNHEASINLPNDDILRDAVWSPCGNIVYTTIKSNNVVSMSRSGNVIKRITDLFADFLSVSTDEVICLADFKNGVYQSTDDGKTWSLVIDMPAGWQCAHAIRVSTDNDKDVFWTHEVMKNDKTNRRLQVCIVDKHCSGTKVTRHNVTLPSQVTVNLQHTRLAFDGHANIFVADANNKAVYVWSVHGQYECQLLFPQHFSLQNAPKRLAVNTRNDYMYVGQFGGIIDIFKLTYKEIK